MMDQARKFHIHNQMDSDYNIMGWMWRVYEEDYERPWPRGYSMKISDTNTQLPKLLGEFKELDISLAIDRSMDLIRSICPEVKLTQITIHKA